MEMDEMKDLVGRIRETLQCLVLQSLAPECQGERVVANGTR
jgi:hypothetical protein